MRDRLLQHLHHTRRLAIFRVVARPLQAPTTTPTPNGPVALAAANEAQVRAACADPELDMPLAFALAALARGDACTAAFDGDTMVGYVWSSTSHAPHDKGIWVTVPHDAVYRYKAFVHPAWRGRALAPRLYHFDDARHVAAGRKLSVGFIAAYNRASLAAARRSGSRPVGTVLLRGLAGGRLLAWHSPAARRMGLRFYRP